MAMAVSCSTVVRVRGLPSDRNINEVTSLLERSLHIWRDASGLKITSLAEDPYQPSKQVATIMFLKEIPPLFTTSTANKWSINLPCSVDSDGNQALTFDIHFHGLTALNTPSEKEGVVDCVAVCGLGGHAFGSFKEKGTSYMWLRDSLPIDMPNLRVLLYGYESGLDGSDSNQNVSVIADSFVSHLSILRSQSRPISTPLVIIAHSLGGLVVKQAIIRLAGGNESDKKQMESLVGLLFFGVPNRGMDVESLQAIVGDQQNRYLLESLGQYSDLLLQQDGQFGSIFHFRDSHVVSFYETRSSPTAIEVNGLWKMAGPKKVLVPRFSATRPRLWESETYDEGFERSHSDLVKFSVNDVDYERVLHRLREVASKATATVTSRYLSHESPSDLNADEEACLRSLSFVEMYARESVIEQAVRNTGNWLLDSQNFHNWIQRTRLQEHRGFFWIQGNPGSGKSTLMKKIYSHVKATPQDPSSVLAAFFFNARGNELEKSPTGLFRTLLHKLCQRISALRNLVVNSYVAKCRLMTSGWQWQLSELKELLASVVTSSVLGKRSLLLFVDALDECDLAATQSVIQFFEDLATSSLSEGSSFNICLSSRYWPIFRIRNCFVVRVELENEGDINRYIEKHLDLPQVYEKGSEVLDLLRNEIRKGANGIFLWVVLVIRDLLNASFAGATLGELRSIVRNIPPDLAEIYQRQLRSTKGKDRGCMLRLLQLVFYAQRPLSPTELRYALAFGCKAYSTYMEWSRSSEYVGSDEQMEMRIRQHSKGLVEIAQLPGDNAHSQFSAQLSKKVVQFVHQSVIDFLAADGFSFLRDSEEFTHSADGHKFFENACLNYLSIKDFEALSIVELRVNDRFVDPKEGSQLEAAHPFLKYTLGYLFPHAAQAERHGVSQDCFRAHIFTDREFFERWRCLHDAIAYATGRQGHRARPLHVFAQYGLLKREIVEKKVNIDIVGGLYGSALAAACFGGHQDAVKVLLDFGADPNFNAENKKSPLSWAVSNEDLPMLRLLLNNQRYDLTLLERLKLLMKLGDEESHSDYLEAVLALLFPEVTFPNTAIDDLGEVACYCSPRVLSFLLDKFDDSIMHEENLWRTLLSGQVHVRKLVTALLDRGGRVKITGALIKCFRESRYVGETVSLLLEHCDVDVSEDLLISLCAFMDSAQIVRTFRARGFVGDGFDSFKSQQLLLALEFGNAETAAFFLQHQASNTPADEMLKSAMRNWCAREVTLLLLGHLNPDCIGEEAAITALENDRYGGALIRLLCNRQSSLSFSDAMLEVAARKQGPDVVKLVLEGLKGVRITEQILTVAAANEAYYGSKNGDEMIELLLHHDPAIRIQEPTVIAAIGNHIIGRCVDILRRFCRHQKSLPCTDLIVSEAATAVQGPDALDIIFKHGYDARISRSMVMMAMQADHAAALIAVMLQHDHTIVIDEEHLIAAASNRHDPRTIFAFLQTKGKLGYTSPTSDVIHSGPAKRRRISPRSLPRVTGRVIDEAFINNEDDENLPLLELFLEWGLITQAEFDDRHNYDCS